MADDLDYKLDDFRAWVDGASIQIRAVTKSGDPLDLATDEVREIIAALIRMVRHIDGDDP